MCHDSTLLAAARLKCLTSGDGSILFWLNTGMCLRTSWRWTIHMVGAPCLYIPAGDGFFALPFSQFFCSYVFVLWSVSKFSGFRRFLRAFLQSLLLVNRNSCRCGFQEMELFRLQSLKICIMEKVRSKLSFIMPHVLQAFAHYMIRFFSGGPWLGASRRRQIY